MMDTLCLIECWLEAEGPIVAMCIVHRGCGTETVREGEVSCWVNGLTFMYERYEPELEDGVDPPEQKQKRQRE